MKIVVLKAEFHITVIIYMRIVLHDGSKHNIAEERILFGI